MFSAPLLIAMAALSPAADVAPPELTDKTLVQWRDLIRPKPKEVCFEDVPWRTTFWEAVLEAQKKEMPILLWTMNGHPLACT